MTHMEDLDRRKLWLTDGDFSRRAAAADALSQEGSQQSLDLLIDQLRREADEWVFVFILHCVQDIEIPSVPAAVAELGESLSDPYLRFVFLNWAISCGASVPCGLLAKYIEDGPWFVRLSAAAVLRNSAGADVAEMVRGIIEGIQVAGLGSTKEGIRTSEIDRVLYDKEFALSFARGLLID